LCHLLNVTPTTSAISYKELNSWLTNLQARELYLLSMPHPF
jgi:hypothetical protein